MHMCGTGQKNSLCVKKTNKRVHNYFSKVEKVFIKSVK